MPAQQFRAGDASLVPGLFLNFGRWTLLRFAFRANEFPLRQIVVLRFTVNVRLRGRMEEFLFMEANERILWHDKIVEPE